MKQRLGRPRWAGERYVTWRELCLRKAGFAPSQANRLASDTSFDLHALLELVDRGCRPDLAVRIRAPDDWEPER